MSDEPETLTTTAARWIVQRRSRAIGDSVWIDAVEGLRWIWFHFPVGEVGREFRRR